MLVSLSETPEIDWTAHADIAVVAVSQQAPRFLLNGSVPTNDVRHFRSGAWSCSSLTMTPWGPRFLRSFFFSTTKVRGSPESAAQHGVYAVDEASGHATALLYGVSNQEIDATKDENGQVPLVAGIVFFRPSVCAKLLALTIVPPMNACTYLGLDDGAASFRLSLFVDMIKVLSQNGGAPAPAPATLAPPSPMRPASPDMESSDTLIEDWFDSAREKAKMLLRAHLHDVRVSVITPPGAVFVHMPTNFKGHVDNLFAGSPLRASDAARNDLRNVWSLRSEAYVISNDCSPDSLVINSIVGAHVSVAESAAVCHSQLDANKWEIGEGAFVCGVNDAGIGVDASIKIEPGVVVQQLRILLGSAGRHKSAWTVFGQTDALEAGGQLTAVGPQGTFCNEDWSIFFARTGIKPSFLWDDGECQIAGTAKLFPLMSHTGSDVQLHDILWLQPGQKPTKAQISTWKSSWRVSHATLLRQSDLHNESVWRETVSTNVGSHIIGLTLKLPELGKRGLQVQQNSGLSSIDCSLLPFFKKAVQNRSTEGLFKVLDDVATTATSPGVAARALACIADLLGECAQGKGGLRSGPGRNSLFSSGFDAFERKDVPEAVRLMGLARAQWMKTPDLLIRASRHYESAAQILIRHAVMTALQFIRTKKPTVAVADIGGGRIDPKGAPWVVAETAARLDIAGGWTDTPPISYEHGGLVTNFAILIDGKRPIGAKIRRISQPVLELVMGTQRIVLTQSDQLADYTQPQSPGALLKAAFCCAEIVSIEAEDSLEEQLLSQYGGGFELHTWSHLPTGSGLGTSSILAGAIMAALWKCTRRAFTNDDLVHAVLHLEQMLTTGGGWQDQVGGLVGGFKSAASPPALPLKVSTAVIQVPKGFSELFSSHLVLIYTGKTRLARNLLQNVIRNWYARDPALVTNTDNLVSNAKASEEALALGDLEAVGKCVGEYWEHKKIMAPGCEPTFVRQMMDCMRPFAYGQSMAGAGGGGFMYVVSKKPNAAAELEAVVRANVPDVENVRFHNVAVDDIGLNIYEE